MVHVVQLNMLTLKFILLAVNYFAAQKIGSWHKVHETAIFLPIVLMNPQLRCTYTCYCNMCVVE